jgi:hypothetical protein
MINPDPAKLEDILNSSLQYVVPNYQREYKWGKDEALEFLDDLKGSAETGKQLFLGTLIFDVSNRAHGKIAIVDGQQRVTTILLLLVACRERAKALGAHNIATKIQDKITFTDPTTAESVGARLISSESIRDVFEEICKADWSGLFPSKISKKTRVKRQVSRLKPTYDYFASKIASLTREQLSAFLKALYSSYAVRIDIEDVEEAFSIFERTNARGLDLEASDLLKNYLFAAGVPDLEAKWQQILDNAEGTILRMLKFFYVAKKGYVAKAELYKKIKEYSRTISPAELVGQLEQFSEFYSDIRLATDSSLKAYFESIGCSAIVTDQNKFERVQHALQGLRLFKISQIYPVLYAALSRLIAENEGGNANKAKLVVELFEQLERYHFVNNAVCDRVGNEVEKLYAEFSAQYALAADFETTTKALIDALKKQLATEEEFVSRFVELTYEPETIPLIAYVFDRFNNYGLHPGQRIPIFNADTKVLRKNHNIEHFYPQNPVSLPKIPEVDNIGNLLAISFRTNSKLGNAEPQEKLGLLTGKLEKEVQNLYYVREFAQKYAAEIPTWSSAGISARAKDMASIAYKSVWKM